MIKKYRYEITINGTSPTQEDVEKEMARSFQISKREILFWKLKRIEAHGSPIKNNGGMTLQKMISIVEVNCEKD